MTQATIGIIAGHGNLAKKVILSCQEKGTPYHVLAYENQCDPTLVTGHPHTWLQIAKVGKTIKTIKDLGISKVVMTGYFSRPQWNELKPDLKGMLLISKMAGKALGDDGLLRVIIAFFEEEGIDVISAEHLLGDSLLIDEGILTTAKPSDQDYVDINRGFDVAKTLGRLDVGQGVVVQNGVVLGVEGIEGTDAMIQRCGTLKAKSGTSKTGPAKGVFVKVIKPNQDTRVDRSVIGPKTVLTIAKAGFAGIAAEAKEIIIVERDRCIDIANQHGLFLIGLVIDV